MCLGAVSACRKIQIWGEIQNRKIPVFWPSLAPSDLIWVTLGQDTMFKKFRLTFWPRFYISRNCFRNPALENDMEQYNTSFCREFRCASCWHSHLNRLPTFWKKYPGCPQINEHRLILQYTCSKNPGASFFRNLRSAAGSCDTAAKGWYVFMYE